MVCSLFQTVKTMLLAWPRVQSLTDKCPDITPTVAVIIKHTREGWAVPLDG